MQVWFQQNSSRIVVLFLEQARGDSCGPSRWHGARGHCVGTVTPAVCLSPCCGRCYCPQPRGIRDCHQRWKPRRCESSMGEIRLCCKQSLKDPFSCIAHKKPSLKTCPSNASLMWAHGASRITHHASVIVAYINRKSWTKKQVRIWTELWSNGAVCSYCRCSLAKPHFGLYWNNHKINFSLSFLKKIKKMNPIFRWLTGGFLPMTFISQRKPSGLLWEKKRPC